MNIHAQYNLFKKQATEAGFASFLQKTYADMLDTAIAEHTDISDTELQDAQEGLGHLVYGTVEAKLWQVFKELHDEARDDAKALQDELI